MVITETNDASQGRKRRVLIETTGLGKDFVWMRVIQEKQWKIMQEKEQTGPHSEEGVVRKGIAAVERKFSSQGLRNRPCQSRPAGSHFVDRSRSEGGTSLAGIAGRILYQPCWPPPP